MPSAAHPRDEAGFHLALAGARTHPSAQRTAAAQMRRLAAAAAFFVCALLCFLLFSLLCF
jgi:hypothetical protein